MKTFTNDSELNSVPKDPENGVIKLVLIVNSKEFTKYKNDEVYVLSAIKSVVSNYELIPRARTVQAKFNYRYKYRYIDLLMCMSNYGRLLLNTAQDSEAADLSASALKQTTNNKRYWMSNSMVQPPGDYSSSGDER